MSCNQNPPTKNLWKIIINLSIFYLKLFKCNPYTKCTIIIARENLCSNAAIWCLIKNVVMNKKSTTRSSCLTLTFLGWKIHNCRDFELCGTPLYLQNLQKIRSIKNWLKKSPNLDMCHKNVNLFYDTHQDK